jgi:soluble lytic murein transglycosylase-like protein
MDAPEVPLWTDHPPHTGRKKNIGGLACRILVKTLLSLLIFILCFHITYPVSQIVARQQTIHEMTAILERQGTDLAHANPRALAELIYNEAVRYNHDPKFILALIATESSFRNSSVSSKGAVGLMQIMPFVAEAIAQKLNITWRGNKTLFNPFLNIKMGVYYLNMLMLDFKDPGLALTAYNYGPTYVKGFLDRGQRVPPHCFGYYRRVLESYWNI